MYTKLAIGLGLSTILVLMLVPLAAVQILAQTPAAVSIVPNASTLADKAFSPNPVNVSVGDNVTWTNKDTQAHTVTSGAGVNDANKGKAFDSSPNYNPLLVAGSSFSHKFNTAGDYPYFCQLHPTMIGTVHVATATTPEFPVGVLFVITAAIFAAAIFAARWNKLHVPGI